MLLISSETEEFLPRPPFSGSGKNRYDSRREGDRPPNRKQAATDAGLSEWHREVINMCQGTAPSLTANKPQQIEPAKGKNNQYVKRDGAVPFHSRKQAATDAGLSEHLESGFAEPLRLGMLRRVPDIDVHAELKRWAE